MAGKHDRSSFDSLPFNPLEVGCLFRGRRHFALVFAGLDGEIYTAGDRRRGRYTLAKKFTASAGPLSSLSSLVPTFPRNEDRVPHATRSAQRREDRRGSRRRSLAGFDSIFRERKFICKLMTLGRSRCCTILKTLRFVRVVCSSLSRIPKERKRGTIERMGGENERRLRANRARVENEGKKNGGKKREQERLWKKGYTNRAFTRAKDETPSSAQYGSPRLFSILKCYVPGIASCGSRPLRSPPFPNLYGSPFSSMHVKFALSDRRLCLSKLVEDRLANVSNHYSSTFSLSTRFSSPFLSLRSTSIHTSILRSSSS